MNSLIETLNHWGSGIVSLAWPMLWQSSLLIAALFILDFALRRKVRAAIRYAFWLVVLVKLILPPSLALPTGLAWWLRSPAPPPPKRPTTALVVTYGNTVAPSFPSAQTPRVFVPPPRPPMSAAAWTLVVCGGVSAGLLAWLLIRWGQVARKVRRATAPDGLTAVSDEARGLAGLRSGIRLRLTEGAMSPAVCGLFRPVILLPRSLAEKLPAKQLRAVLLHEVIHLRRGDVWVNCAQALLQIVYWWHPLLWLANARIRRVREEAVDDAVMIALGGDAETYAPTLLEVAKLAFNRPLASLGLVGILESRSALRQRIERLVNFRPPRKAGLTLVSLLEILAFTALAVPMGEAPQTAVKPMASAAANPQRANVDDSKFGPVKLNLESPLNPKDWISGYKTEQITNLTVIEVHEDGSYWLGTNQVNLAELKSRLSEAKQATSHRKVRIEADAKAPYKSIVALMDLCKESSISSVELIANARHDSAATLVQEGRFDFEAGKFDEAEASFDKALSLEPGNQAALYYLNLLQRARTAGESRQSGPRIMFPSPQHSADPTNHNFTANGRQEIVGKLNRIYLDSVQYDNVPLSEVIRNLSDEVKQRDPEKKGVNFITNTHVVTNASSGEAVDINSVAITINQPLSDVLLADMLDIIVKVADKPIRYSIEDYGVVFSLKEPEVEPLYMRVFRLDVKSYYLALGIPASATANSIAQVSAATRNFLMSVGVVLTPPKSVFWNDRKGELLVRATMEDLDIIEKAIETLNASLPATPAVTNVNTIATNQQGILSDPQFQEVLRVLDQRDAAAKASVEVNGSTSNLDMRTFKEDPKAIVNRLQQIGGIPSGTAGGGGGAGGFGGDGFAGGFGGGGTFSKQAVASSGTTDRGAGTAAEPPAVEPLYMRTFKVDPNTFLQGLESVGQATKTNLSVGASNFFNSFGANLNVPGASIYWNDRKGELLVRATLRDLDIIEKAIEVLNVAPPQVNIKVRFVEVPGTVAGNLFLGKFDVANISGITSGGVSPSNYPSGAFPGKVAGSAASTNSSLIGILTAPLFKVVLKALEQLDGVDMLNQAEVTTLSGRQAHFEVADLKTIATGQTNVPTNVTNDAEQIPLGPSLDVIAYVSTNGQTIQMTLTARLTEFLGYIDPGPFIAADSGRVTHVHVTPLPRFRSLALTNSVIVWDGQTAVLGGLSEATSTTNSVQKNLIIFVTPTIIDPAGNRVHSGDPAQ